MQTWIRRLALGTLATAALLAAAGAGAVWMGHRKLDRQIATPSSAPWAVPTSAESLARGAYLYASRGCADCHGKDGAGKVFIQDGDSLLIKSPNISPGPGSVAARYTPQDWTRLMRHGVKPNGRAAFIMPSEDYARWTQEDLAALVAHVRQLPPVAGEGLVAKLPPPMVGAYGLGLIQDAAEKIAARPAPPATPVPAGISVEHGAYVAQMCVGCHGAELKGGRIPGGPPDWPAAAALSGPQSVMARYPDAASFQQMLKSGRRPDGAAIQVMPFDSLRELNDVDAQALHLYLKQL